MLRNIPITELIRVLLLLQRRSAFCTIELSEDGLKMKITPVEELDPRKEKLNIEIPIDPNLKLKSDDLDKFIV